MTAYDMITPPHLIRERLAEVVKEARMLRSLLRISIQLDKDRDRLKPQSIPQETG